MLHIGWTNTFVRNCISFFKIIKYLDSLSLNGFGEAIISDGSSALVYLRDGVHDKSNVSTENFELGLKPKVPYRHAQHS